MANLSHLKVQNAPSAFADWAVKHNELVSLIESIEAATGLDIKIVHSPAKKLSVGTTPNKQSQRQKGRIRIGLKSGAILGQVGGFSGTGGGSGNVGNTTQAVGIDGKLYDVLQPTSPNSATNYPTKLVATNGTSNVSIENALITLSSSSVFTGTLSTSAFTATSNSNGSAQFSAAGGAFIIGSNGTGVSFSKDDIVLNGGSGGASLQISRANITQSMTIKTISVCVNGNAMSMLVIGSEPF